MTLEVKKKYMRNCLLLTIALIFGKVVGSESLPTKEKKSMLADQPYFQLRLEVSNTPYAVSINGVEIRRDMRGLPINFDMPINQWMRSGKNTVAFQLFVEKGEKISTNAKCKVELIVHQADSSINTAQIVSRLEYAGELVGARSSGIEKSTSVGRYNSSNGFVRDDLNGDVQVSAATIHDISNAGKIIESFHSFGKTVKQSVKLYTPLPKWAFFDSDDLTDPYTLSEDAYWKYRDELFVVYKQIYDALKAGDVASILPMFDERNRELDAAFYYRPGTMAKKISKALNEATADPERDILFLEPDSVGPEGHPNNKLVSLQRDNGPAIIFNYKTVDLSESYDLVFRRQNGKWILTR